MSVDRQCVCVCGMNFNEVRQVRTEEINANSCGIKSVAKHQKGIWVKIRDI